MNACFPAGTVARLNFEERAQLYYERWEQAIAEDNTANERLQRGLSSPFSAASLRSACSAVGSWTG